MFFPRSSDTRLYEEYTRDYIFMSPSRSANKAHFTQIDYEGLGLMRFESHKNEVIPTTKQWLAASWKSNSLTNFHNKHTKDTFWLLVSSEVLKICSSSWTIYYASAIDSPISWLTKLKTNLNVNVCAPNLIYSTMRRRLGD